MGEVPAERVRALNACATRGGDYVLYWMTASRRTRTNPALQHAIALGAHHDVPVFVFEPLRAGYRWASLRHHTFVAQGMDANREAFARAGMRYVAWLERTPGDGRGLLEALAQRAVRVVTDDWPGFFHPRMREAVAARLPVLLEAVDGNGLLPLADCPRVFTTAASFRRHLQKVVRTHLDRPTERTPLAHYTGGLAPSMSEVFEQWPGASLDDVEIDRTVGPVDLQGGEPAGQARLADFLARIDGYTERNHPDKGGASGLSPYLHFGHVSGEEVARRVLENAGWAPEDALDRATGSRGWWGLPEASEAFMDEVVTWRELASVFAHHRTDHDRFSSLPDWAHKTLAEHGGDPREPVPFEDLEAARSPDPVWNAAQRELLETGRLHNYLRMLWGKKVLGWAPTPEIAFEWLTELNNKYALDGRDPSSSAGIAWVFGRHDRAWGPERPIFGKVRYMTSDSTKRKLRMRQYLARFGA